MRLEAEFDRIDALVDRHLVDETLDGEGVEHVAPLRASA